MVTSFASGSVWPINSNRTFDVSFSDSYIESIDDLVHNEKFINSKNIFLQWIVENRSHLPGIALNQYKDPIQSNVDGLNSILSLELVENDENIKFKNLLNEYLDFENEFLENLI